MRYLHVNDLGGDPPLPAHCLQKRVEHCQTTHHTQSSLYTHKHKLYH